jgi:hypothetical protein
MHKFKTPSRKGFQKGVSKELLFLKKEIFKQGDDSPPHRFKL